MFRCLRFVPFVAAGDARLATQWSRFLLLWQDLHLQDVRGFSQRTAHADETAPPLVKQINNGNWPSTEEAQQLRDELFYTQKILDFGFSIPDDLEIFRQQRA